MTGNRIELWGRIAGPAELRSTPTGVAVLRIGVDCGANGDKLVLTAVITGERARDNARFVAPGMAVRLAGKVRNAARGKHEIGRAGLEVIVDSIELREAPAGSKE